MQEEALPQIGLTGGEGEDAGLKDRILAEGIAAPLRQGGIGATGNGQRRIGCRTNAFGGQLAVIGRLQLRACGEGSFRGLRLVCGFQGAALPIMRAGLADDALGVVGEVLEMGQRPVGRAAAQGGIAGQKLQIGKGFGAGF